MVANYTHEKLTYHQGILGSTPSTSANIEAESRDINAPGIFSCLICTHWYPFDMTVWSVTSK